MNVTMRVPPGQTHEQIVLNLAKVAMEPLSHRLHSWQHDHENELDKQQWRQSHRKTHVFFVSNASTNEMRRRDERLNTNQKSKPQLSTQSLQLKSGRHEHENEHDTQETRMNKKHAISTLPPEVLHDQGLTGQWPRGISWVLTAADEHEHHEDEVVDSAIET